MRYKRLGSTDLVVSELGFGAWGIGGNEYGNSYGPTDDNISIQSIRAALDCGCTLVDTADVYGRGRSELLVGRALRDAGRLYDIVVASKVGTNFLGDHPTRDFSVRHISAAIEATLQRLRREYLDLYQLHNPSLEVICTGQVFETLDRLRDAGKIRHYGVSIHTSDEGLCCIGKAQVQTLQIAYNLFSYVEPDRSVAELLFRATQQDIGIIAREPLASGFLSGRHSVETVYGPGDVRAEIPSDVRKVYVTLADSFRCLARAGITQAQAALRFVLDDPMITTTVVGIKTPAQAKENFAAVELPCFEDLFADASALPRRHQDYA